MRIAHVVPRGERPSSGVLTAIVELAAAVAARGHHVELMQLHRWDPAVYAWQLERSVSAGVEPVALPDAPSLPRLAEVVRDTVKEHEIDVVHLHGAFNLSNTATSRRLRTPYVFSPHSGYEPESLRRGRLRKAVYGSIFERAMLGRAAVIVALTEAEREDVHAFGARGECVVIPNGVRDPLPDVDPNAFRRELSLPPDRPLVVFVGRLDVWRKGLDRLVRGLAHAPGWDAALVGPEFRDVGSLRAAIRELDVVDRVHLVGERVGRRLFETFAAADVFVLLSRWEGLPIALLEALSFGKPAIVSRPVERAVGVDAAGAGWVVDDDGLAAVLTGLLEAGGRDAAPLATRGRAASALVRRFRWESVAEMYDGVYQRAARAGSRATP